jgi:hypothetical protein
LVSCAAIESIQCFPHRKIGRKTSRLPSKTQKM